jgi:hypothetical protein
MMTTTKEEEGRGRGGENRWSALLRVVNQNVDNRSTEPPLLLFSPTPTILSHFRRSRRIIF